MKLLGSAVFCVALGMVAPAMADPQYSAGQIVDFFMKSANQGVARGLCIGTADECDTAAKPAGFDMLINFNLASDELTAQARANLDEFARALKDERLSAAKFVVEGHTDASGNERYNEGLAERRAKSVTKFLLEHGIRADMVTAVGMGEREPRVDNIYDPVNRRVEMRISLQ